MIRYFALAFALVLAVPAFATDWNWDLSTNPSRSRAHHVRHYYRHVNIEADNRGDRDRDRRDRERADAGWLCLDKVRGLGTQWIGTEGALDAARKDWMERVRYDHGEVLHRHDQRPGLREPLRARLHRRGRRPGHLPLRDHGAAVQAAHEGNGDDDEIAPAARSAIGTAVPPLSRQLGGGDLLFSRCAPRQRPRARPPAGSRRRAGRRASR